MDKYGNVITQARVLVNNVTNRLMEYEDNCKPEYNKRKSITNTIMTNANRITSRILPNPNKGNMILEYDLGENTSGEMRIFDLTGKLVNLYNLKQTIGKLEINEQNLNSGVYYYSIILNGNVTKTDKIIIIK